MGAAFLIPAALAYTVYSYRVFRGKVAGDAGDFFSASQPSWAKASRVRFSGSPLVHTTSSSMRMPP